MIGIILFTFLFSVDLQRPTLTFAQAQVESGVIPNTKAKGRSGERGSMQVIPSIWGKVPKTYKAQLKQGEKIREALIKESFGDIRLGLKQYNGIGKPAELYASKVITRTFELTLLGT